MEIQKILDLIERNWGKKYHNPRLIIFSDGSGDIRCGYGENDLDIITTFENLTELKDALESS